MFLGKAETFTHGLYSPRNLSLALALAWLDPYCHKTMLPVLPKKTTKKRLTLAKISGILRLVYMSPSDTEAPSRQTKPRTIRFHGIGLQAQALHVSRGHLWAVLSGKRKSGRLVRDYHRLTGRQVEFQNQTEVYQTRKPNE